MLHDIWMAETRKQADTAFDLFITTFQAKYPKAIECLTNDRDVLLSFYDFPAEHWVHLRTTNPIESTFATVRLRTRRTKGCGRRTACLTMVFKLAQCADKLVNHWSQHKPSNLAVTFFILSGQSALFTLERRKLSLCENRFTLAVIDT